MVRTSFSCLMVVFLACGGGGGGGGVDTGGKVDAKDAGKDQSAVDTGQDQGHIELGDVVDAKDSVPTTDDLGGGVDAQAEDVQPVDQGVQEDVIDVPPSDSKDTGQRYHPEGWATPGSANFHGKTAKQGISQCTTCHGADLTGGAVQVSCDSCHQGVKTNCVFCHGGKDNQTGAPPVDISDGADTTLVTVGAHTAHVSAKSGISVPFDCVVCHKKPSSALDPDHIDGSPAEVLASNGWDRQAAVCATAYCHGNFIGGNTSNKPKWTASSQAQCGSCHALPPSTGRHPSVFAKHSFMGQDCTNCHNGIANNGATQILDPTKHINQTKDVVLKAGGTWNPQTKTCDPACHGAEQW